MKSVDRRAAIRMALLQAGFASQRQFAHRLGYSEGRTSHYITGRRHPSPEQQIEIRRVAGRKLARLLGGAA